MAFGNTRSREITAHHEAAHAVVAIELGVGILDVGIDLNRFDETGGLGLDGCRLFVANLTDVRPQDVESEQHRLAGLIDRTGAVLAAGAAAEAKIANEDAWVALHRQTSDIKWMRKLLDRAMLAPNEQAVTDRLRSQLQFSVEVLDNPDVWQAVGALAEAVLTRGPLSGAEIESIVEAILAPRKTI